MITRMSLERRNDFKNLGGAGLIRMFSFVFGTKIRSSVSI